MIYVKFYKAVIEISFIFISIRVLLVQVCIFTQALLQLTLLLVRKSKIALWILNWYLRCLLKTQCLVLNCFLLPVVGHDLRPLESQHDVVATIGCKCTQDYLTPPLISRWYHICQFFILPTNSSYWFIHIVIIRFEFVSGGFISWKLCSHSKTGAIDFQ